MKGDMNLRMGYISRSRCPILRSNETVEVDFGIVPVIASLRFPSL